MYGDGVYCLNIAEAEVDLGVHAREGAGRGDDFIDEQHIAGPGLHASADAESVAGRTL